MESGLWLIKWRMLLEPKVVRHVGKGVKHDDVNGVMTWIPNTINGLKISKHPDFYLQYYPSVHHFAFLLLKFVRTSPRSTDSSVPPPYCCLE